VRFNVIPTLRNQYFGSNRVNNINSLPFSWYWEKQLGGGDLYIYFLPDQDYPCEIHGLFQLNTVSLNQDLSTTIDEFYRTYLRYCLADRICSEYNFDTPPNVLRQLGKYQAFINSNSRLMDLRLVKQNAFQEKHNLSWAYVNIGHGWLVP